VSLSAQENLRSAAASSFRAVLTRGPDSLRGLPFFAPNAIPSLRAEYLIVSVERAPEDAASAVDPVRDEPQVRVWFTREPVVLSGEWKATNSGGRRAWVLARAEGLPVLALVNERYALFLELPQDDSRMRAFAAALERRFTIFFENAPSDADLSLPAFVEFFG
jgi:hypothetical protein